MGLTFELVAEGQWQPRFQQDRGSIFVRAAPYTGWARFQAWATTAEGAAAAIGAAEALSTIRGLANDFAKPDISGVSVATGAIQGAYHKDAGGKALWAQATTAIESAGVVGAALHMQAADAGPLRPQMGVFELADAFVVPAIEAALQMLESGGFLGRTLCRIDFVALSRVVGLEWASADATLHVHVESDLALPADAEETKAVARLATTALGRSGGLPTWDAPPGMH